MATDKQLLLRSRAVRDKETGAAYRTYSQAVDVALAHFDRRRVAATCTEHRAAIALDLGSDVEMARIDYRNVQDAAWRKYLMATGD